MVVDPGPVPVAETVAISLLWCYVSDRDGRSYHVYYRPGEVGSICFRMGPACDPPIRLLWSVMVKHDQIGCVSTLINVASGYHRWEEEQEQWDKMSKDVHRQETHSPVLSDIGGPCTSSKSSIILHA